jgi:hypothetical protein
MEKREGVDVLTGKREVRAHYVIPPNLIFRDYLFLAEAMFFLALAEVIVIQLLFPNIYAITAVRYVIAFQVFLCIPFGLAYAYGRSPVREWIVENEKCPSCGGRIKSCSVNNDFWVAGGGGFPTRSYIVHCSKCNKEFIFTSCNRLENDLQESDKFAPTLREWIILIVVAILICAVIILAFHLVGVT